MTPKIGCNIITPSQNTGLTQDLGSVDIQTAHLLTADESKQLISQVFPAPSGPFDNIPTDILFWEDLWKQIARLRQKLYRMLGKLAGNIMQLLLVKLKRLSKRMYHPSGF